MRPGLLAVPRSTWPVFANSQTSEQTRDPFVMEQGGRGDNRGGLEKRWRETGGEGASPQGEGSEESGEQREAGRET